MNDLLVIKTPFGTRSVRMTKQELQQMVADGSAVVEDGVYVEAIPGAHNKVLSSENTISAVEPVYQTKVMTPEQPVVRRGRPTKASK